MKKKNREWSSKLILGLLAAFLLPGVGGVDAYNLEVQNLPAFVSPGGGTFTFDLFITNRNTVDDLAGWQYQIDIEGRSSQDFVDFDYTATANTEFDPNYIYYGNSFDYQVSAFSGDSNKMLGADMVDVGPGNTDLPALIAHVEVDYSASAYGTYDIVLGVDSRNYIFDYDFLNSGTDPNFGNISGFTGASVTVLAEPISSILFLTGGVTLGFRRYRNRRRQS